jgi:hypothetical protein
MSAPGSDLLIEKLNKTCGKKREIRFVEASDEVVAGADLADSGNRQYGKNIYIATGKPLKKEGLDLTIGRTIQPNSIEVIGKCELRCNLRGKQWTVAVYDESGKRISRELSCWEGSVSACDEGWLAWLSPVESYCTPWSDNDPEICQVVTVERLRKFASHPPGKRKNRS